MTALLAVALSLVACSPPTAAERHSPVPTGVRRGYRATQQGSEVPSGRYAYVGIAVPASLVKVDLVEHRVLKTIRLSAGIPWSIALSPDGRTAYVTESGWNTQGAPNDVVPVSTATDRPGRPIKVGSGPISIAITPDGSTAFVANMGSVRQQGRTSTIVDDDTVTPIDLATGRSEPNIRVGPGPGIVAITPDGRTAYVGITGTPSDPAYDVVPIDVATRKVGAPIRVGTAPMGMAITPDGATAYVANTGWQQVLDDTVTPVDLRTGRPGNPITVGESPLAIAMSPDGKTAYVVDNVYAASNTATVVPIGTASNTTGKPIEVGKTPYGIALTPDGKTLYVLNSGSSGGITDTITPIDTATGSVLPPMTVGRLPVSMVFLPAPRS